MAFSAEGSGSSAAVFPTQSDMSVSVVSEHMNVNGVDMAIYDVISPRSIDDVARFYETAWRGRVAVGKIGQNNNEPSWTVLSHREGNVLTTVQLQPRNASGLGCHALIAISTAFAERRSQDRDDFPIPSDSKIIDDIRAEDLGRASRTLVLQNEDSVGYNEDYFRQRLQAQGWAEVADPDAFPSRQLEFRALLMNRGADEVNLTISRSEGVSTVVIVRVKK
jgi:hypothetical protein